MSRLRTLFFLIPLFFLTQTAQVVQTAPMEAGSVWKPGLYRGSITIKVVDHHSTPEGVDGKEEYTFYIPKTSGEMEILIDSGGRMHLKFRIVLGFTNAQWDEVPDDKQGNCRGMVADATGYGSLSLIAPVPLMPAGDVFSGTPQEFNLWRNSFKATVWHLGSNCDETDEDDMFDAMEAGLQGILLNEIDFMVEHKTTAGMCTMFEWENDPERSYTCSWKVFRVTKKK